MRQKKIVHPQGYPYALYQVFWEGKYSYVPAVCRASARKQAGADWSAKVYPARVEHLVETLGHTKTSKLLANVYPRWTTKDGMVFYKNV